MRVALVITGGVDRSGRERVIPALVWLIERLARRHDVHVYVLRHHDAPCDYPFSGATVHDLGRPEGIRRQYAALSRAWRTTRPDVVHAYWALPAGLAGAAAARRRGIPSVVTFDSGELTWLPDIRYGLQGAWRQRVAVAATARFATRVTVCTMQMESRANAHGLAVRRIPIGVDAGLFTPGPARGGPPWRLLHIASLNPVKDQETLLRAFRLVRDTIPACRLEIVGEDTMEGRIHRVAEELDLRGHVTFHGFQPTARVAELLKEAHLHVLSSRHEAAGVAVLEAAASAVPTVGSAVGYVAEWMPDRAVGVNPGDPRALADAITALLRDEARRRALGERACAWARAHDADATAAAFEQLYEEVI